MKTLTMTTTFDAYPNGKKAHYAAGDTLEVSDAFGTLILAKGLAREAKPADGAAPAAKQETKTDEAE